MWVGCGRGNFVGNHLVKQPPFPLHTKSTFNQYSNSVQNNLFLDCSNISHVAQVTFKKIFLKRDAHRKLHVIVIQNGTKIRNMTFLMEKKYLVHQHECRNLHWGW